MTTAPVSMSPGVNPASLYDSSMNCCTLSVSMAVLEEYGVSMMGER